LRLSGLDPDLTYTVRTLDFGDQPRVVQDAPTPWLAEGVRLPGRVLVEVGLPMPLLTPGNAIVLHATA
jgi:alpha-galactosidase